jgi:hypothetical protein
MRNFAIILFIFLVGFCPSTGLAQSGTINAGFVEGIWFAHDPVVALTTTRIYVALRNNTDTDLSGVVRFSDNGKRIGSANVSALPGRIVEAWVDWEPSYGEHAVTATLTDVRVYEIGENPTSAEIESTLAERILFVDYDTDSDGLLNEGDLDDDNDTVSDELERERGTDPLTPNPIPKDATEAGDTVENKAPTETVTPVKTIVMPTVTTEQGLERYLDEGTIDTLLGGLTSKIVETKGSLDAYRSDRVDQIEPYFKGDATSSPQITFVLGTSTGTGTPTLATITRTQAPDLEKSFVSTVVDAGKAILSGIYSFILWIFSRALSYPAVLELVFLLFLIYFIYRTARRFGRRRSY